MIDKLVWMLTQCLVVTRKLQGKKCILDRKTRAAFIFLWNNRVSTKAINGKICCCLPLTLVYPVEPR